MTTAEFKKKIDVLIDELETIRGYKAELLDKRHWDKRTLMWNRPSDSEIDELEETIEAIEDAIDHLEAAQNAVDEVTLG
jgi:hypothetical protein